MNLLPIVFFISGVAIWGILGDDPKPPPKSSSATIVRREARAAASPSSKFTISSSTTFGKEQPAAEPLKDCGADGKQGNAGAQIRFTSSALEAAYAFTRDTVVQAIRAMSLPDVMVPLGGGFLSIRNARIVETKLGNYTRRLVPDGRAKGSLKTCVRGGRIVSVGEWTFRPISDPQRRGAVMSGLFRTVVVNPELNMTNDFGRRHDGKPMTSTHCQASLEHFRIEIEGFGEETTVLEQCDNPMCSHIRNYFQGEVCRKVKSHVDQFANQKFASIPTRIRLGPSSSGNRFVLDYSLFEGDWPRVTQNDIRTFMKGEVLARGSIQAPIHAAALANFDDDQDETKGDEDVPMLTFKLSDAALNTLFHHAHVQQFRFSAFDSIPATSSARQYLKMHCSSRFGFLANDGKGSVQRQAARPSSPRPASADQDTPCLGSVFDSSSSNQDGFGDLVFKSQRALQVVLQAPSFQFGVDGGVVEAYGPIDQGKRELLGRADVGYIRGSLTAKMDGCNITGQVSVDQLQLSSPSPTRLRSLPEETLGKLAQLCLPVLTEMFNSFMAAYAQFPIPLADGFTCDSPNMEHADNRTIQVSSQIRSVPDSSRIKVKNP